MDAHNPATPPPPKNRKISGSSAAHNNNDNISTTTASPALWSSARRREKREKSIRMLQEEIQKQLEEEGGGMDQPNIIITPTKTRSLLSSQRWVQIQAEAMVQAAIRADEEIRRRGSHPPFMQAMNASQIAEYSQRRAREIVMGDNRSNEVNDTTSTTGNNTSNNSLMDMESRVTIQARALEHAITQSQINAGILLDERDAVLDSSTGQASSSVSLFPDPSILPRSPPLFHPDDDPLTSPFLTPPPEPPSTTPTPTKSSNEKTSLVSGNRKLLEYYGAAQISAPDRDMKRTSTTDTNNGRFQMRRGHPSMKRMCIFLTTFILVIVITFITTSISMDDRDTKNNDSNKERGHIHRWSFLRGGRPFSQERRRIPQHQTTIDDDNHDRDNKVEFATIATTTSDQAKTIPSIQDNSFPMDSESINMSASDVSSSYPSNNKTDKPFSRDDNNKSTTSDDDDDDDKIIPQVEMYPVEVPHDSFIGENPMKGDGDVEPSTASPSIASSTPRESTMTASPHHKSDDDKPMDQVTTIISQQTVNNGEKNEFGTTVSPSDLPSTTVSAQVVEPDSDHDRDKKTEFTTIATTTTGSDQAKTNPYIKDENFPMDSESINESASDVSSYASNNETDQFSRDDNNNITTRDDEDDDDDKIIPQVEMYPIEVPSDSLNGENPMRGDGDVEPPTKPPSIERSTAREAMMTAAPHHKSDGDKPMDQVTTISQQTVNTGEKNKFGTTLSPSALPSTTETAPVVEPESDGVELQDDIPTASIPTASGAWTTPDENADQHVSIMTGDDHPLIVGSLDVPSPNSHPTTSLTIQVPNDRSKDTLQQPHAYPMMAPSMTKIEWKPDDDAVRKSSITGVDKNNFIGTSSMPRVDKNNFIGTSSMPTYSSSVTTFPTIASAMTIAKDADGGTNAPRSEMTVLTPSPNDENLAAPTLQPTISTNAPSIEQSSFPTEGPSCFPTDHPTTTTPTEIPTNEPSHPPSLSPTRTTSLPTVSPTTLPAIATSPPLPQEADWFFASILLDDLAFYFPSEVDLAIPVDFVMQADTAKQVARSTTSRAFIRQLSTPFRPSKILYQFIKRSTPPNVNIDWSLDWKKHMSEAEAIGDYYINKGMDLVNGVMTGNSETPPHKPKTERPKFISANSWAFDWIRDPERAIMLGKTYGAIGEAIDDHYREAFGIRDSSSRILKKSKDLVASKHKGMTDNTSSHWQYDWERGLQIASLLDDLAATIQGHYFDLMFEDLEKTAVQNDRDELLAGLYAAQGRIIVANYQRKSRDIRAFYAGSLGRDWKNLTMDTILAGKAIETYYLQKHRFK